MNEIELQEAYALRENYAPIVLFAAYLLSVDRDTRQRLKEAQPYLYELAINAWKCDLKRYGVSYVDSL